jgi:hypothetical protein
MMRRLTEDELSRAPARRLCDSRAASPDLPRAAALLANVERVLEAVLLDPTQRDSARALLEHAIARGLRGES